MKQENVIGIVCRVCHIRPEELKLRSRKEPLPTARALAAHFLYRNLKMRPVDIFPLIGPPNGDRTRIYHYVRKGITLVEVRSPFQRELKQKAELIRKLLRQAA